MKMMGVNNTCKGCSAKESDPECDCKWATCRCGAWDCWIDENGDYGCSFCGYESNPDMY